MISVVSLFSGGGGLDLGFVNAGFKIIWAVDSNADAISTYRKNIRGKTAVVSGFYCLSIQKQEGKEPNCGECRSSAAGGSGRSGTERVYHLNKNPLIFTNYFSYPHRQNTHY